MYSYTSKDKVRIFFLHFPEITSEVRMIKDIYIKVLYPEHSHTPALQ
jgi:hypothetical protein